MKHCVFQKNGTLVHKSHYFAWYMKDIHVLRLYSWIPSEKIFKISPRFKFGSIFDSNCMLQKTYKLVSLSEFDGKVCTKSK